LCIDPKFTVDQVAFSIEEFLELVKKLPAGRAIVADEIGQWFSSRDFMKTENKDLSAILQIFRINRLAVIYTLPNMYQVDKNLRVMSDAYIMATEVLRKKNMTSTRFYELYSNPITGKKVYTWFPKAIGPDGMKKKITKVYFDRIPPWLERAYLEKKRKFNMRIIEEKIEKAKKNRKESKEKNDTKKDIIKKLIKKGMRTFEIARMLNTNPQYVSNIKQSMKKETYLNLVGKNK